MDKTPKVKTNFVCKSKVENNNDASDLSLIENAEFSPNFISCTQEGVDVDVVWDWNSPHSKPKQKFVKRKFDKESPKLTLKKHPSNNQIQTFDKLKVELEALRNHLIEPVLVADGHNVTGEIKNLMKTNSNRELFKCDTNNVDDFFNDDFDEELVLCSQKEEQKLLNTGMQNVNVNNRKANNTFQSSTANDSFDFAVGVLKDDDFDMLTQVNFDKTSFDNNVPLYSINTCDTKGVNSSKIQIIGQATKSESPIKCSQEEIEQKHTEAKAKLQAKIKQDMVKSNINSNILSCSSKTIPCDTQTGQILNATNKNTAKRESPIKYSLEEIERKRIEAKIRLQTKMKQDMFTTNKTSASITGTTCCSTNQINGQKFDNNNENTSKRESPIKCSPEEIEQKRIETKAKLQAKIKQDNIIERKRLEALKRLEMSRRKRTLNTSEQDLLPKKIINR